MVTMKQEIEGILASMNCQKTKSFIYKDREFPSNETKKFLNTFNSKDNVSVHVDTLGLKIIWQNGEAIIYDVQRT